MSQKAGQEESIAMAIRGLSGIDVMERCSLLGLPLPEAGVVRLRIFGRSHLLRQADFSLVLEESGQPGKLSDHILLLHYLLCDLPIRPSGQFITFRDFPGGQFYWPSFLSRTVLPLTARIGNDLSRLPANLDRFDWEPMVLGDLSARVHVIGGLHLHLIYHCGDDEFPAALDVLYDSCAKRVYGAEDASAIAHRICLGLM